MGRGGSTLVLLLVALGFGGYLYFVDSKRPVTDANAKKKVFSYASDKITQVEMKSGTETTVLRKNGDNWSMVQPAQADADRTSVSDVVTNVANLEEERVVDENAADLKPYGLAEPRVDLTFHVEGEKEPKRVLFGDKNPTGMGTYAKLPGNNRVFLVSTAVDTMLGKSAFDFRDKTALKFEQDKVTFLELASGAQTIRLEKSGEEWKLVRPLQAPADYIAVNGLVGQLQSAQMTALKDRPEDVKDLKQYGLDKPEAVATIGMGSAAAKFELGTAAEGGAFWARDPSKPVVFSVSSNVADELRKKPDDFAARKSSSSVRSIRRVSKSSGARRRARSNGSKGPARTRSTHGSRCCLPKKRSMPATSKARCWNSRICARTASSTGRAPRPGTTIPPRRLP